MNIVNCPIKDNIYNIKENIAKAAIKSGRKPEEILLLGVTKTIGPELMDKAFDLGITNFGENRVQEYLKKSDIIKRECCWHLIGRLQTNKVKYLDHRISLIHSLDRLGLALALQARGEKINYVFPVLIQVNVSGEDSKAGIAPEQVENFILAVSKMGNIKIRGLMTIAPLTEELEDVRPTFRKLKKIFVDIKRKKIDNVNMEELSMGMSGDYIVAIEEGSTIVRIGSAIFGERVY